MSLLERKAEMSVVLRIQQAGLMLWEENSACTARCNHSHVNGWQKSVGNLITAFLSARTAEVESTLQPDLGVGTENFPAANVVFAKPLILTISEENCSSHSGTSKLLSDVRRCSLPGTTRCWSYPHAQRHRFIP